MNVYFTLLRYHVLRDNIKVRKRFMHESSDVVCPLQDLGINVRVDEIQQLVKNFFDVTYLRKVCDD